MNSPELAALGVRPDVDDLYVELLRVIKENDLGREVVTNGFVLEIKGYLMVLDQKLNLGWGLLLEFFDFSLRS